MFDRPLTINLALQGGGAHGAFTWGVLDRLLEVENLRLGWVSATSAGAVNAVALASGLAAGLAAGARDGGRAAARSRLRALWEAVAKSGVPDFVRLNPFLYGLARSATMSRVASMWSPYEFNPLGFDPLRQLLEGIIDFEAVRRASPIELLIAATDVRTGRARLFRRHEATVEAVLASACLPSLHHAVEIEGRAYWDGGFSANPDLVTLARSSPVGDTLIVKLSPLVVSSVPRRVVEIAGHVSRLTFNAPLLRDVAIIAAAQDEARGRWRSPADRLARHRFHLIDASRHTTALSADSKMKPDAALLQYLFGAGRAEAEKWLALNRRKVGRTSTVDLKARFLAADARDEAPVALPAAAAGEDAKPNRPAKAAPS